VGNDLVLAHPHAAPTIAHVLVLSGGPAIYLLGSAIYKKVVYGTVPVSHIAGAVALAAIAPLAFSMDLLQAGLATTVVMLAVCIWEDITVHRRRRAKAPLA
jgi:low temperature requirement protein LtrA